MTFAGDAVHYADDVVESCGLCHSDVAVSEKCDDVGVSLYDAVYQIVASDVLDKFTLNYVSF